MKRALFAAIVAALSLMLGLGFASLGQAKGPPYVIGLGQPNVEHPYRVGGTNRAKDWAKQHPDQVKELIVVDGRRNSAVQLDGLEDLLVRGVDAIILSPNDSDALKPIAASAKRKGVPLIIFDRKLNVPDEDFVAYVGADNVEMGRVAARSLVKDLGGKGVVIQLEGTPGASATVDRKAGFEEVMNKEAGIKYYSYVGHYRRHEAVTAMEDAVVAHRDLKAVYAHNDSMAIGAAQVLKERGIKAPIIGMDGGKEGCDAVADGSITGSVYYPTMFPDSLEVAVKVLKGESVPKRTMLDTPLITKANHGQICK